MQVAWSYKHRGGSSLQSVASGGPVPLSVCFSISRVWKGTVMSKQCPGLRHVPWSPYLPFSVPWDT